MAFEEEWISRLSDILLCLLFEDSLGFRVKLLSYDIDDTWVESAILAAHACLNGPLPSSPPECDFCAYATQLMKAVTY